MTESCTLALPERVIAIMAYGRAGSGLWASLFDSHSDVVMFPDCVIMDYFHFWDRHGNKNIERIAEEFVSHYSVVFDARESNAEHFARFAFGEHLGFCNMGPDKDRVIHVDKDAFLDSIYANLDRSKRTTRKIFFQVAHLAYARALGREVSDPVIVFGLHVAETREAMRLLDDFPRTVFLQTIREPVKGMASWFRHFCVTDTVSDDLFYRALGMAFDTGKVLTEGYANRWFGVRLEDIHRTPEATMRRVSSCLGLRWNSSLLESTFNGLKWWNEKKSISVNGFSESIIQQSFDEYLSQRDRWLLSVALSRRAEAWGYATALRTVGTTIRFLANLPFLFEMEKIAFRKTDDGSVRRRNYWKARRKLMREYFCVPENVDIQMISGAKDPAPKFPAADLLLTGGDDANLRHHFFESGEYLLENGSPEMAVEQFSRAIACMPNVVAPYEARARAYQAAGKMAEANRDRSRAGLPPLC